MPLRGYRCAAGHEFEVFERMDDPERTACVKHVSEDDSGETVVLCEAEVERVILQTQRPIVRDGTRLYHGTVGVSMTSTPSDGGDSRSNGDAREGYASGYEPGS